MSNGQNHAGDVILQNLVDTLCNRINILEAQDSCYNLLKHLETFLSEITRRSIFIICNHNFKITQREFPQFTSKCCETVIWCCEKENSSDKESIDSLLSQCSIASVLVCCGPVFVDNLPPDVTTFSFYKKWPEYFSLAIKINNELTAKLK